ncbi:FAD-binding protein [bacterium]|nr:FAD-binding protein [bacterium]
MVRSLELKLSPAEAADPVRIQQVCARQLRCPAQELQVVVRRRSVDARKGDPKMVLLVDVYRNSQPPAEARLLDDVPAPTGPKVIVVGAGPAGYFAALELILLGLCPVVVERGKDTRSRRYDLRSLMQDHLVHPHSNYCFGEGGAGTYSDGKLYTRSDKRGDTQRVLKMLVECGARSDILQDTHPHIGSNKLPGVVENLRATLLRYGAEIHFEQPVVDLIIQGDQLLGVRSNDQEFLGQAVILATGHSARDIFELLERRAVTMEAKPFALGLRIEHPQALIDEIQYRQSPRDPHLPASSYRLACQVEERGVYSFCMCPGGLMVPAATAPGEIVVNGMSMSGRNSRWANSGIVVEVGAADWAQHSGPLAAMRLQQSIEQKAFAGSQQAPAARLTDYLQGRVSQSLPASSYVPGLHCADLDQILPPAISSALRQGLEHFCGRLKGFHSQEAVVVGVESRTSSPIRIPREAAGLFHPQWRNLYPCGEGPGYAGGILSAAMDGQRVARAVARDLKSEV